MTEEDITPDWLRSWFVRNKVTHAYFAHLAGVKKCTVDSWCRNKRIGKITKQKIKKALTAHAFSTSPESLQSRLSLFSEEWTPDTLYTESEWHEICREAAHIGITPAEFQQRAVRMDLQSRENPLPDIPFPLYI